jgi:hypothetical protein
LRADELAALAPKQGWQRLSASGKGGRLYDRPGPLSGPQIPRLYRHITLSMLAIAFLAVTAHHERRHLEKGHKNRR